MRKSEILEILGDAVMNYNVVNTFTYDGEEQSWLEVRVNRIRWIHLHRLTNVIMGIEPWEKGMVINFDNQVEID